MVHRLSPQTQATPAGLVFPCTAEQQALSLHTSLLARGMNKERARERKRETKEKKDRKKRKRDREREG